MSNEININGITIKATFAAGHVELTFIKDGKVVKVCRSEDASRFVKPENLAKVTSLVAAVNDSAEAAAYWATKKVERDSYEAEYQERTGNYESRTAAIKTAMAI